MNQSMAHISSGKEINGEGEYDPFGETLYMFRGKEESNCHLAEAMREMPRDQFETYKSKCKTYDKLQRLAPDSMFANVAAIKAHKYLMKCVKEYWAKVEERLDGARRE